MNTLAANVQKLFDVHERQWELENLCRDPSASLANLGRYKRGIDRSNAQRVATIGSIDLLLESRIVATGPWPELVYWPVTLGQALDQIVIAVIRCERADADPCGLRVLRSHQIAALDDMFRLLLEGSVVLPPMSTVKHYKGDTSS